MRNFELPSTYENEAILCNLVNINDWEIRDEKIFSLLRRATRYSEHNKKYLKAFADENSLEGEIWAFPIRVLTVENKPENRICILCSTENRPVYVEVEDNNGEIPLDGNEVIMVEEYLANDEIYIDVSNNKIGILQNIYY